MNLFCLSCQITFVVPSFVNPTDSKCISANHKDENRMLPLLVTLCAKPCSLHLKHFALLLTKNFWSVSTRVWHRSLERKPKSCDEKKLIWVKAVSAVLNLSSHPQYLQHVCTFKWRLWAWVAPVHLGYYKTEISFSCILYFPHCLGFF